MNPEPVYGRIELDFRWPRLHRMALGVIEHLPLSWRWPCAWFVLTVVGVYGRKDASEPWLRLRPPLRPLPARTEAR